MIFFLKILIASILLFTSLYFINERLSTDFIKIFNYDFYILVFCLLLTNQIILSLRWYILSKSLNQKIKFLQSINFSFKFTSFANISFSGGSEIFRFLNLRTSRLKFRQMIILILTEKFFSLISILIVISIGVYFNFENEKLKILFVIIIIFLLIFFCFIKLSYLPYINYLNYEFSFLLKKITNNYYHIIFIIIFSVITQFLSIYLYYLFFIQFTEIDINVLFLLIPITNLLISLSFFTFNGIGVREILLVNFSSFLILPSKLLFNIAINASFVITIYMLFSFLISNFLIRPKIRLK
tara:strand:+ start:323 stop:1213 length:891 start_codon:yes stop_codon:yes gene_type:complete